MNQESFIRACHGVGLFGSLQVFILFAVLLFLFDASWLFLPFSIMIVLSTALTYTVKWVFPMRRPDYQEHPLPARLTVWNYWQRIDSGSFPSAHAVRTAGLAAIAFFFPSITLMLFSLLLFIVVSASRVLLRRHRWLDVIGGGFIGAAIGIASWYLTPLAISLFG